MSKLGDKKVHKELDDMTPSENLVVAEDIIDELYTINGSLREEKATLREALEKLLSDVKLFHAGGETWASVQNAGVALKENDDAADG